MHPNTSEEIRRNIVTLASVSFGISQRIKD